MKSILPGAAEFFMDSAAFVLNEEGKCITRIIYEKIFRGVYHRVIHRAVVDRVTGKMFKERKSSMRKSMCLNWIKKYFEEVSGQKGSEKHQNPCVKFREYARQGIYNLLSDDDYNELLAEAEELSDPWERQASKTSAQLLANFISELKIDDMNMQALAEILADCYEAAHGEFTAEDKVPRKDGHGREMPDIYDFSRKRQNTGENEAAIMEDVRMKADRETVKFDPNFATSPKAIKEYISRRIYGQEEAVKAASLLLYNHIRGRKRNLLFIGPTGCGKTEIWRTMQEIYPCIRIIDTTAITMQGWSGSFKIQDIFCGMSTEEIERAIIVFDEFDKFCEPKFGAGGTNYAMACQNELLKMIEGARMFFPQEKEKAALEFDSSGISFVFCGSFESLVKEKNKYEEKETIGFGRDCRKTDSILQYENTITPKDLVTYAGIRQEIAGRIQQIVQLRPMTEKDFLSILRDEHLSPLHTLERQYGVRLHLNEKTEKKLAEEAAETGFGVRYLHSRLQEYLDEQIYGDCNRSEYWLDDHVPYKESM